MEKKEKKILCLLASIYWETQYYTRLPSVVVVLCTMVTTSQSPDLPSQDVA